MTTLATEETAAVAVLALLNAALPPKAAYDLDALPPALPVEYVEMSMERMNAGEARHDGYVGTVSWRCTLRAVSKVSLSNARLLLQKSTEALEFVIFTVGSRSAGPAEFETAVAVAPDDGYWAGSVTFTIAV